MCQQNSFTFVVFRFHYVQAHDSLNATDDNFTVNSIYRHDTRARTSVSRLMTFWSMHIIERENESHFECVLNVWYPTELGFINWRKRTKSKWVSEKRREREKKVNKFIRWMNCGVNSNWNAKNIVNMSHIIHSFDMAYCSCTAVCIDRWNFFLSSIFFSLDLVITNKYDRLTKINNINSIIVIRFLHPPHTHSTYWLFLFSVFRFARARVNGHLFVLFLYNCEQRKEGRKSRHAEGKKNNSIFDVRNIEWDWT